MLKRVVMGLVACFGLLAAAHSVAAQSAPGISQKVAVCNYAFANRCIAVNADGSINTTPTGSGSAVTTSPSVVVASDKGGTITAGGTAQTPIAANSSRKGWCIQNDPANTTATAMRVRSGSAATSSTGQAILPGQQACNPPGIVDQGIVSILGANTGDRFNGTEYQ